MAVNCFAGAGRHWRSRMFSPAYGVVEDAATGSAAGPLAIHLARHRQIVREVAQRAVVGVQRGQRGDALQTDEDVARAVAVDLDGKGRALQAEGVPSA